MAWLDLDFRSVGYIAEHPRTPRPAAITGLLSAGDLVLISGSWDTYKSWFGQELVGSLATGQNFLRHFPVRVEIKMGIVQAEIDPGSYDHRVLPWGSAGDNLMVCSDFRFDFSHLDEIAYYMEEQRLGGMLFDPLGPMWPATAAGGESFDENRKTHVTPILKELKQLPGTIILVHHDPKPTQGQTNRASGSSALLNDPDSRIFLNRTDGLLHVTARNRLQQPLRPFYARFEKKRLIFSHFSPDKP